MINTWEEINSRYDVIKNNKSRAAKKLKELSEILASAYILDPQKADEMWQYIIELNIEDNITYSKFYIAQVFNKIIEFLAPDEAAEFVSMRSERVSLMFNYGYIGLKSCKHVAYIVIGKHILERKIDEAIEILSILEKRFSSQEEEDSICSFFNFLYEAIEEKPKQDDLIFRYDIPIDSILSFYDACYNEFKDDYIQAIILARIALLKNDEIREKESTSKILYYLSDLIINLKIYDSTLKKLFLDFLFFEREVIDAEKVIFDYCCRADSSQLYIFFYTHEEFKNSLKKTERFQNIISSSNRIIQLLFEKYTCDDFLKNILRQYMYDEDWKQFLKFLVLGLNQEKEYLSKSYLEFVKEEIQDYLFVKDKTIKSENGKWSVLLNKYGTSWNNIAKPRISSKNVSDFIKTLGQICILTSGSSINQQIIEVVGSFATKETGNVDTLNAIGIEVKTNNKTELDRFCEYAEKENLQRTPYDNSYHRQDDEFIKNISKKLRIYGVELGKLLAKQPQILSFLFLHNADSFRIKGDIILGALLDNNYQAALKCVDYMIETAGYPNFSAPKKVGSWSNEMKFTIDSILREVVNKNTSEIEKSYSENITSTVIQIAEKCLPYLDNDDVKDIKAELFKLKPTDDNDKDEFISQIMQDVDSYIAEKQPKGYSKRIKDLSRKILKGIELMFEFNRTDIIAQILRKIKNNKSIEDTILFDFLGNRNFPETMNKQYFELYSLIPDMYASYIEVSDQKMAIKLLRRFGYLGNYDIYKALKDKVIQKHGYIEGINSCFHYSEANATPIALCNNLVFELKFLYFKIFESNWQNVEVVLWLKNKNEDFISLFASDISINGIPLAELQKHNKSEYVEIVSFLSKDEESIESFSLYLDKQNEKSLRDISEISFSIISKSYDKDIVKEGPFTIIRDPNNETFMLKR